MTKIIPELTDKDKARFWAKVDVRSPDECWPWLGTSCRKGYGVLGVAGGVYKAHRIAAKVDGRDPVGLCSCHACDNPPCCNPSHIWNGTNAENVADKEAKGRGNQPRGDKHPSRLNAGSQRGAANKNARLSDSDVRAIRADGRTLCDIAASYGVTFSMISHIKRRRAWSHID